MGRRVDYSVKSATPATLLIPKELTRGDESTSLEESISSASSDLDRSNLRLRTDLRLDAEDKKKVIGLVKHLKPATRRLSAPPTHHRISIRKAPNI
jgi:hypothetical protein